MCYLFLLWRHTPNIEFTEHFLQQIESLDKTDGYDIAGYGMAGYSRKTRQWKIHKSIQQYNPDARLIEQFSKYSFIVGHLRNMPKSSVNTLDNIHPFAYRNQLFMHNGIIEGLCENSRVVLDRLAVEFRDKIVGDTDTELFFYLYLTMIREANRISPVHVSASASAHAHQAFFPFYTAMIKTLEFLQNHFRILTANVFYTNREYTIITRYHSSPSRYSPTLYWNIPKYTNHPPKQSTILITTKREHSGEIPQTMMPDRTLVCIENISGKIWVLPLTINSVQAQG